MSKTLDTYVCPIDRSTLMPAGSEQLQSAGGNKYEVKNGIPQFIAAGHLTKGEAETKQQYEEYYTEEFYDNIMDWLFESFYESEEKVRESMIDSLELKPGSRVLEVGCGTGCDSFRIARRLGPDGIIFLQDLSSAMVEITRKRIQRDQPELGLSCQIDYFVSTARNLPFPDHYFDAVYHFGGFNNFDDPKGSLAEFTRITKIGGKVVIGDESVPPWLEGTAFGEIVCTNNPLFRYKAPIQHLPESARDVNLRWTLGNCFYVIDYRVGEGPPRLNLDLPHKGRRGGTMRTRYYGVLEGVTVETKQLMEEAAKKKGESLHAWLDKQVSEAAKRDLAE